MRHFVFLAYAQRKLNTLKRTLSIICRNLKKGIILSLRWVYAKYFLALAEHALKNFKRTISMRYKLFSVSLIFLAYAQHSLQII